MGINDFTNCQCQLNISSRTFFSLQWHVNEDVIQLAPPSVASWEVLHRVRVIKDKGLINVTVELWTLCGISGFLLDENMVREKDQRTTARQEKA